MTTEQLLRNLGIADQSGGVCIDGQWSAPAGGASIESVNPATGRALATVAAGTAESVDQAVAAAHAAFLDWRTVPAPVRGEFVRQFGNALRDHKADLGRLVTLECGKLLTEGEGEVQEMIDVCDFAVGLSRQLYGKTIASERPAHRMFEQWHPLGVVGIISAFNFPVAVWAWNAAVACVCGDACVWKPSELTPLVAMATHAIAMKVAADCDVPPGVFQLVVGDAESVGVPLCDDRRVPLVSATGSCAMGRKVAARVAGRLGRTLLELGGNNAIVLTPSADMDLALRGVLFAAVGTAGQRCTTLRRLIVHESVADGFTAKLVAAYGSVTIGDPAESGTLMGPLISAAAVGRYEAAVAAAKDQGGTVLCGGRRLDRPGHFVEPTVVRIAADAEIVRTETFAPILYVMTYADLDEAVALHNAVDQGLSSAILTDSVREAERFLGPAGSDCGIANVNIGTSGAEIGGAFGGEKDTGGGRESGSDSWKAYMRRQTCTVNYGADLPLAQGVKFDLHPGAGAAGTDVAS